jgi:cation transport ATPase
LARELSKKPKNEHVHLDKVTNFKALPGLGVQGTLHGKDVFIAASYRYIEENSLTIPADIAEPIKQAAKDGKTEVYLITNKQVVGAMGLADVVREQSVAGDKFTEKRWVSKLP